MSNNPPPVGHQMVLKKAAQPQMTVAVLETADAKSPDLVKLKNTMAKATIVTADITLGTVHTLTCKDDLDQVMKDYPDKLVVLQVSGRTCAVCRLVEAEYSKMASDHKEAIFAKIDAELDSCEEILDTYGVTVTPTFVLLRKSAVVAKMSGKVMNGLRECVKKQLK